MGEKVRAIVPGFRHGARVRAGAVFELDEGEKPGKWMEKLNSDTPAKPKKAVNGDTKPVAAQEAVKEKVAEVGAGLV